MGEDTAPLFGPLVAQLLLRARTQHLQAPGLPEYAFDEVRRGHLMRKRGWQITLKHPFNKLLQRLSETSGSELNLRYGGLRNAGIFLHYRNNMGKEDFTDFIQRFVAP